MNTEIETNIEPKRNLYAPVMRLTMIKESKTPVETKTLSNSIAVFSLLREYLAGADREHLVAIALNVKNKVLAVNTVSIGHLSGSIAHPREVFKFAILANAGGIILGHNHPSGDPAPSEADRKMTETMVAAGKILDIPVLDHVIVTEKWYYSFKDSGFI